MKYKALFLDLDGTLVKSGKDNLPSEKVIEYITKATRSVFVCIATARDLENTKKIIQLLNVKHPCILINGVQIYDPVKGIMLQEIPIDRTDIINISKALKIYSLPMYFYDGKDIIAFRKCSIQKRILSFYFPIVSPKLSEKIEKILRVFSKVSVHRSQSWEKEGYECIDIAHAKATKLHALQTVMKILKVKREECIGVGDSYNDYPLLLACGTKVAMGNAIKELKDIADFIAPSVDRDGIVEVVKKYIL